MDNRAIMEHLEDPKEDVGIKAALVRFVQHHHPVVLELRVLKQLPAAPIRQPADRRGYSTPIPDPVVCGGNPRANIAEVHSRLRGPWRTAKGHL